MRKFIKITAVLCLMFVVGLLLYYFVKQAQSLKLWCDELNRCRERLQTKIETPEVIGNTIESIQYDISVCNRSVAVNSVLIVVQLFALAACAFLFVCCNPRLFRLSTWTDLSEEWAKNKAERAAARSAKAETDKQKRIEELQAERDKLNAELDELNANDNGKN